MNNLSLWTAAALLVSWGVCCATGLAAGILSTLLWTAAVACFGFWLLQKIIQAAERSGR